MFTVDSKALAAALKIIVTTIDSNPFLPELAGVLVSPSDDGIQLRSRSNDKNADSVIDVEVSNKKEFDAFIVDGKKLRKIIKKLPHQPLLFESASVDSIRMKTGAGEYTFSIDEGEDFGKAISFNIDNARKYTFMAASLAFGFKSSYCASTDELRPAMTSILMEIQNGEYTLWCTDASRATKFVSDKIQANHDIDLAVPIQILIPQFIAKTITKNKDCGTVELYVDGLKAMVDCDGQQTVFTLPDYNFPSIQSLPIWESPRPIIQSTTKQDLINTLERVSLMANEVTNQVVFHFNKENRTLTVEAKDIDLELSAKEVLPCEVGETITMGFNAKFLIEALSYIDSDWVYLEIISDKDAMMLTPVGDESGDKYESIVMPVLLHV